MIQKILEPIKLLFNTKIAKIKKGKEEIDIEDIYTPLSVAKKEIWRRWNDKELRKKVENFLEGDLPEFLKDEPKAYFARHIASPNYSFFRFHSAANEIGLNFVCPEFLKDRFISRNSDKYHLCKLYFLEGPGKKGGNNIRVKKIINFENSEGKRFEDIETITGETFFDFHHRILDMAIPGCSANIYDLSDWLIRKGEKPDKFYKYLLSLFICNAVLFENFLTIKEEGEFTKSVVLDNFKELWQYFGVKPLIVRLVPEQKENDVSWFYYPDFIQTYIAK